jgi:hypothetical protein
MDFAIVDECIALIAPDAQHEAECRRQVEAIIARMDRLKIPKTEPSSELEKEKERARLINKVKRTRGRKADREALLRFADALADAVAQLNETSCGFFLDLQRLEIPPFDVAALPAFDSVEFSKQLETLTTVAREIANGMLVKDGKPSDTLKNTVADWAKQLIENHGTKPPTLTIGGPYYQLASVLYGAATGEHAADLSWHCRLVARRTKGGNKQL